MNIVKAVVYGKKHTEFPLDMLRYDRCCTYRETDSSFLKRMLQIFTDSRLRDIRDTRGWKIVICKRVGANEKQPFTTKRWESFGVNIKILEEIDDIPKSEFIHPHQNEVVHGKGINQPVLYPLNEICSKSRKLDEY